jgi:hypothetical protein
MAFLKEPVSFAPIVGMAHVGNAQPLVSLGMPVQGGTNMTTTVSRSVLGALALAGALTLATPSLAEMTNLKADLKAASEVPPNDSKGSGSVTATYDTASKKLSYKGSYSGLAGVQIPVSNDAIAKSPFEGEATLTDAQASDLMAGKWYFNIHTAANKGGEIRGQVTK